jgi:hypothetical protein
VLLYLCRQSALFVYDIRKDQYQYAYAWLEIRDNYRTLAELTEAEEDEAIDND